GAQYRQHIVHSAGRKQAGGAAADEHRNHLPSPDQRQGLLEIGLERRQILLLGHLGVELMRIEIAVRALAYAPWHMHIQGQRGQAGKNTAAAGAGDDGGLLHEMRPRKACSSVCSACARWLSRFFSSGTSSATV